MTLLTYQVFKTVAAMGSFHKAAGVLGLTPSAVSHAIGSMESELGFAVLTRSKSGVTLTNYGEHLLPYVNAVLNSDESLQQMVAEFKGLKTGKVKVGCFASACTAFIPQIIKSFNALYPAIHIEVFQGTYDDVSYWIKNGVVDFGFMSKSSCRDLEFKTFYKDPLVCVVPSDFQKVKKGDVMSVEELKECHFVVQRESVDADIQNYMRSNKLTVQSDYHVVDDLSTVSLVEAGFGICIMPEITMKDIHYQVKTYKLVHNPSREIGLAVLNAQFMAPAVRELYQYILENYANL